MYVVLPQELFKNTHIFFIVGQLMLYFLCIERSIFKSIKRVWFCMRHITFIVLICKNYGVCNILLPKDQKIKGTQF